MGDRTSPTEKKNNKQYIVAIIASTSTFGEHIKQAFHNFHIDPTTGNPRYFDLYPGSGSLSFTYYPQPSDPTTIKHTLNAVAASATALSRTYTVTKVHGLSRYFVNSTHEEQHNIFTKLSIALQPATLVLIIPAFNRGVDLVTLKFVYPNTLGAAGPNEIATRAIIASAVPELIPTVTNSYAPISEIMKANNASSPPTAHHNLPRTKNATNTGPQYRASLSSVNHVVN
jgi:hypothetical protein